MTVSPQVMTSNYTRHRSVRLDSAVLLTLHAAKKLWYLAWQLNETSMFSANTSANAEQHAAKRHCSDLYPWWWLSACPPALLQRMRCTNYTIALHHRAPRR